jgi:SulP family sulfate permease
MLALVFGMTIQRIFKCDSVATISSAFGGMPSSLPTLHMPSNISFHGVTSLLSSAFAIAMLGAIESLLSAVVADKITGTKHSSNQELIGQGIANIACPLFGGIASTGAIARTASNIRAGGNSPLAGIISSLTLMVVICFCAPLAADIPLATLAAIIFMVAYNMSCVKTFASIIMCAPRLDAATLMVTFFLTVTCGIVFAVNVGVVLASLILMYRMSASADISLDAYDPHVPALPREIVIYKISGPLFFGMIDKFEKIMNSVNSDVKIIILRMHKVLFIDTSGLQNLRMVISKFASSDCKVILAETTESVMQKLHRSQVFDSTSTENYGRNLNEAIRIAKKFYGSTIRK